MRKYFEWMKQKNTFGKTINSNSCDSCKDLLRGKFMVLNLEADILKHDPNAQTIKEK